MRLSRRQVPDHEEIARDVFGRRHGLPAALSSSDVERYVMAIMDGRINGDYPNLYFAGQHPNLPRWIVDAAFGRPNQSIPSGRSSTAQSMWGNGQVIEGLAANECLTDDDYVALTRSGIPHVHWHLRSNPCVPSGCVSELVDRLIIIGSLDVPQMESTVRSYVYLATHPNLPITGASTLLSHLMYCLHAPDPYHGQIAAAAEPILDEGWRWRRLLTDQERSALFVATALS